MVTIQQSTLYIKEGLSNSDELGSTFTLINSIQLGLDVVFDIFYSMGILLISIGFIVAETISIVGWFGFLISTLLLMSNLFTFPLPPKESGLIDVGIFTIVWWLLLIWKVKTKHS